MGGSRAHDNHNSNGHRVLHMEEHFLLIRHPLIHRHRQQPAIHRARTWRSSSRNMASSSICPHWGIPKAKGKSKHPTRRFSTASRNPSLTRKENCQMNFSNVWAYCITKRQATSETFFSLAFGSEAIIPPNVIVPSISTSTAKHRVEQKTDGHKLRFRKWRMRESHHPHRSLPATAPLQLQQKGQDPAVLAWRSSPKKSLHHCPYRRLQKDESHLGRLVQD